MKIRIFEPQIGLDQIWKILQLQFWWKFDRRGIENNIIQNTFDGTFYYGDSNLYFVQKWKTMHKERLIDTKKNIGDFIIFVFILHILIEKESTELVQLDALSESDNIIEITIWIVFIVQIISFQLNLSEWKPLLNSLQIKVKYKKRAMDKRKIFCIIIALAIMQIH